MPALPRPTAAPASASRGFAPVARPDARILVLGTLPSRISLERGEYYANPRNQFWHLACELLGVPRSLPYEARLQSLRDRGIALWDVCAAAERPGSLDASIAAASVVPNDFASFFAAHPAIVRVCLNGRQAAKLYARLVAHTLPASQPETIVLPSTSPAHAAMPFEAKRRAWLQALR